MVHKKAQKPARRLLPSHDKRENPGGLPFARSERVRHLKFLGDSLCSLRAVAGELDLAFVAYLIEMAALEARHEMDGLEQTIAGAPGRSFDERD